MNIAYVSSQSKDAELKLKCISEKINLVDINAIRDFSKIDLILVVGGDGTLLHAIHEYMYLNLPFYGMNAGSIGFLMNSSNSNQDDLEQKIQEAKKCNISALEVQVHDKLGNTTDLIAINESSIRRASSQSAKFSIKINDIEQISEMIGDGALVATTAGSSAYNFSAGGHILPISSNALALTAICPFRPRKWNGAILPSNSVITFEILEQEKRPVNATADFHQVENVSKLVVRESKNVKITLLLNKEFENKLIKEQFYCF